MKSVFNLVREALRAKGYDVPEYEIAEIPLDGRKRDWDRCELRGKLLRESGVWMPRAESSFLSERGRSDTVGAF